MSRVQLALNVSDLESSVEFYSRLFNVQPHKLRPGYANFQVVNPPLKLVLIEATEDARGHGVTGALNHLGVEAEQTADVRAALARFEAEGLEAAVELGTTCCYAQQDKVWVSDPAGLPWEVYTITDDAPAEYGAMRVAAEMNDGGCCGAAATFESPSGNETSAGTANPLAMASSGCC